MSGGTLLVVAGSGFAAGQTTVSVGGYAANNVSVHSTTLLTAVTSAFGVAGVFDVAVSTPTGSMTAPQAFKAMPVAPVIRGFTAEPDLVAPGGSSTIAWEVEGSPSVTLDGVAVGPSGALAVAPAQTTTYLLRATSGGAATTASVTVHVRDGGTPLGTPMVTAPGSGETVGVAGVTFAWTRVQGAAGYGLRVFRRQTGRTVFSGSVTGADSTSTLIALPDGDFTVAVRACVNDFMAPSCGGWGTSDFAVRLDRPTGASAIQVPVAGAEWTSSTNTFTWTSVTGAASYELAVQDVVKGVLAGHVRVSAPDTSTILTLPSGVYLATVQACRSACVASANAVAFQVRLRTVPTSAPAVSGVLLAGNQLTVNWSSVAGADLYQVEVVQPPPAGPGGGALTVAARQTASTTATFPVPPGVAYVIVRACTGDGCGPDSPATAVDSRVAAPLAPQIGTPMSVVTRDGPQVVFSWSRVPTDTGQTWYRLYVQDLSRSAPALDVFTRDNFYGAAFLAEGTRYDAVVFANPGTQDMVQGPPVGFVVKGSSAASPTMVAPTHQSAVPAGNVQLGWTPVAGATLYEYFVAVQGAPMATVRGVSTGLFVQVPLTASGTYSAVVRACPAGATCGPDSDAGWGPWSVNGGTGVTNFAVVP